jgi:hypothetical protein
MRQCILMLKYGKRQAIAKPTAALRVEWKHGTVWMKHSVCSALGHAEPQSEYGEARRFISSLIFCWIFCSTAAF